MSRICKRRLGLFGVGICRIRLLGTDRGERMTLTRDQRQVLGSLARGGNCWVNQDIMASLAALGLAKVVDTCRITGAGKYAVTDAGRDEAKRGAGA